MLKNVLLSLINISITAIPFFLIWDFGMYLVAILFQIVIIACTFWNIAGDVLIIRTVLNGKGIPNNSQIKSATTKYLNYLESKDLIETQKQKLIYWANSSVPYFLPVSKRTFVISSALQDYLVRQGAQALIKQFPNEMFATSIIFSRKILLLTVLSYRIIMKVLEWWGIFFLYAIKALTAIGIAIANGSLFGTIDDLIASLSLGSLIGEIIVKIDNCINYIQDKFLEFFIRETVMGHLISVEKELAIK